MKAVWNDAVLAESDDTIVVEGTHYFPPLALDRRYFVQSGHRAVCPWKGTATYLTLKVEGETRENAAYFYPEPKEAALQIKDRIAFSGDVELVDD